MTQAKVGAKFEPGEVVPKSGIYSALHATHPDVVAEEHEVTCVKGKRFPPCNGCESAVRFRLVRAAKLVARQKYFRAEGKST
jgi:hypothetical protein